MRFLVDNALSPLVARSLSEAGYDAVHVRDIGLEGATDPSIFQRALEDERVIVSADTDFATILAVWRHSRPSLILFRRRTQRRPEEQVRLLLANLPQLRDCLLDGCVVVFDDNRIRIRNLPVSS